MPSLGIRTLCLALALPLTLLPCKFTVRDVAFVDLGDPPFQLYTFVETSPQAAELSRLSAASLLDANVDQTIVRLDTDDEHDAESYLVDFQVQRFPTTILVGPDGDAIEVRLTNDDGGFDALAGRALESIVTSPTRRKLLDELSSRYAVAIVVEGESASANTTALRATDVAFAEIEAAFDKMPKDVGDLPLRIVVPHEARTSERVLLWSLGIDEDATEPSVAVLFGRGRRVGPVLDGDAITAAALTETLRNAGRSCECGLDRSWMRGPRVPLRWDATTRERAAKRLGFDADSPLVKAEVVGILARGAGRQAEGAKIDEGTLDYREIAIGDSPQQADGEVETEDEEELPSISKLFPYTTVVVVIVAFLSVLAGVWIMRSKRE